MINACSKLNIYSSKGVHDVSVTYVYLDDKIRDNIRNLDDNDICFICRFASPTFITLQVDNINYVLYE